MDKSLLLDAARQLDALGCNPSDTFAFEQAVRQFNALLDQAKLLYPNRPDIIAVLPYEEVTRTYTGVFTDAIHRLRLSLELRPPGSISQVVDGILLPPDSSPELAKDLQEFKEAVSLGLQKTSLLLAGSIAETLLLTRHPDTSEWGPGLAKLVRQAETQRLFGSDTIRQLETLIDYRDLIHARAAKRNKIVPGDARIEHAVMALKQLCADLLDLSIKFQ